MANFNQPDFLQHANAEDDSSCRNSLLAKSGGCDLPPRDLFAGQKSNSQVPVHRFPEVYRFHCLMKSISRLDVVTLRLGGGGAEGEAAERNLQNIHFE